ncbi:glycosyltransferase [Burkholderia sp. L27(2015)]|uniref:glycosyltransferase n=1 Tax=Burkholderia sp. L27(2015) TaxID=1641858 RepID=UPI00131ACE91|nr:glycosyltransferase [Burkholderia sp. L27(2015)]
MTHGLTIEFIEDSNWLGGSIYIDNLLAALSTLPSASRPRIRLQLLSSPGTPLARRLLGHPIVDGRGRDNRAGDLIATARRIHRGLVRRAPWIGHLSRAPDNELYFPIFDTKQSWRKSLYWIPDFQPHYLPELFDSVELSSRLQSFKDIANSQGILLLSSNAALADFRRFYPGATVEPRVWSFCSSIEAGSSNVCNEIIDRFGLPEKFLYVANQFWRHKDHATVFEALRLLRDKGLEIPLVCTGLQHDRRDPDYFGNLVKALARDGLQRQVRFLGVVPREEQVQLLRAAAAILQPSRFEGWSTVIEDAKALGRPIIASDIAVHAEQLSGVDGAYLFRVSDATDLAERVAAVWPDLQKGPAPQLEALANARRNLRRQDTAHQFVTIVDEAVAHSPGNVKQNRKIQ